jgi:hypothetical protein
MKFHRTRLALAVAAALCIVLLAGRKARAQTRIAKRLHNLSQSGSGKNREKQTRVCIDRQHYWRDSSHATSPATRQGGQTRAGLH